MIKIIDRLLYSIILLIPLWITAISRRSWQIQVKKILISMMLLLSVVFSICVFIKGNKSPSRLTIWVGDISLALYLGFAVTATVFSWSKMQNTFNRNSSHPNLRKKDLEVNKKRYITIPSMTGIDANTSITFINATFILKNDHLKKYPDADFGAWLVDEIHEKKKIFAVKKGLFSRNKTYCPNCSSELNFDHPEIKEIEYDLQYKDFPPFQVRITLLTLECRHCKKMCGIESNGSSIYHLNEAIITAFESENIKP